MEECDIGLDLADMERGVDDKENWLRSRIGPSEPLESTEDRRGQESPGVEGREY